MFCAQNRCWKSGAGNFERHRAGFSMKTSVREDIAGAFLSTYVQFVCHCGISHPTSTATEKESERESWLGLSPESATTITCNVDATLNLSSLYIYTFIMLNSSHEISTVHVKT